MAKKQYLYVSAGVALGVIVLGAISVYGHGTSVSPQSRVYKVYKSNPENPDFELAREAVAMDGKNSYYTWNQVSRNIPDAVNSGLPEGFDYSPWVPDGQIASGGRVDPDEFPGLTYSGLDQVSSEWPTTPVFSGEKMSIDFFATAVHEPSVWDVWMTTADWDPNTELNWAQMEFLTRPKPELDGNNYTFDLDVPDDRLGHHALWIAWQRDDAVGEVFFSTSDLMISAVPEPGVTLFSGIAVMFCMARRRRYKGPRDTRPLGAS